MAGPWEKYASQTAEGPWSKYAAEAPPSNDPATYPDYPGKKDPAAMRREFARKEKGNKTFGEKAREVVEVVEPIARPTISGGLSILGGAAGLASPMPGGTVVGGTLGYAAGQQLGDVIFGERGDGTVTGELKQAGRDIYEGAQGELLGLGLGAATGKAVASLANLRTANPIRSIAERRARDVYSTTGNLTEREAANAAKSQELTSRLGVELTPAQRTGKPSLQSLEQGLASTDPEFAATLSARDAAAKQKALSNIRGAVGKEKPLPKTQELTSTGQDTIEAISGAQTATKPIHEELYSAIPNTPQPTDKIKSVVAQLKKNFRPGDEEVYPARAIARVEEAIKGKQPSTGGHGRPAPPQILDAQGIPIRQNLDTTKAEVGFQDLHSLRKDIGRQIQDATTGAKPNRELAAKLTTIKNAIDDTIEETMGADNQYKSAKDAFIEYAGRFRTGAVEKVLRKGNESSGLRIADENINRQFFTPSGAAQLKRAVGAGQAKEQMRPFVVADMLKSAAPDGANFNAQVGINYINKNRAALQQLGLVDDAKQILKDQFPAELERLLAKRAPDPTTGQQFFSSQDMRTILQKYGSTIKQLYGADALQSFRDYNQLMGMIERKNLIPRGAGSNTAEKAMAIANAMIAKSGGPEQRLTEGLLSAILQGTGAGGALGYASGQTLESAAAGASIVAGRQIVRNVDKRVAQVFGQILKEATLNPQVAKDLITVKKTGKVPLSLTSVINRLKEEFDISEPKP